MLPVGAILNAADNSGAKSLKLVGIPGSRKKLAKVGDVVTLFVMVNSSEQNNYVAWHWARNAFGFHRIPFTVYGNPIQGGNGWYVTFTRTVTVYPGHLTGVFNGFINASTHESLYDDVITKFSSTEIGVPYRVKLF